MSEWGKTLMVVVPENLMQAGNALALAIGTSDADSATFRCADFAEKIVTNNATLYQNEDGESVESIEKIISYGSDRFAVANTKAVDQIMDYFALVPAELTENVAFPVISDWVITGADMSKIQVFVDQDPFYVLDLLGLVRV